MLFISATIGNRHGPMGGVVKCDQCDARWDCDTEATCAHCGKTALCDVGSGAETAVCVECVTFHGDGVNHADACDGAAS